MVVVVHHLNKSRSHRIVWLLEELGVPYEIKKYERKPNYMAPKELRDVHPLGKSPIITDGDKTIAETGAIVEYLTNRYPSQIGPPKSDEDLVLKYSYWLHFAEGSAMPPLLFSLILSVAQKNAPWYARPIANGIVSGIEQYYVNPNLKRHMDFMEAELAKNPENWFVKDFSAVDIVLSYPIELTSSRKGIEEYPHLQKLVATVQERPAYKRAVEKAGYPVPRKW